MNFNSLFPCFCHSVIPNPVLLPSVLTMISLFSLWCARQGNVVSSCFILLKSVFRSVAQSHSVPFFLLSCCLRLSVFWERLGTNFAKFCMAPRKDFNVLVFVGGSNLLIASVFSLFDLMPSCDTVCSSFEPYYI